MGYNHFRYARRVLGTNELIISYAGTGTVRPKIVLENGGNISLYTGIGKEIRFKDNATNFLTAAYNTNVTTLSGGGVTGDDLILKANTLNDYPIITLNGNTSIDLQAKTHTKFFSSSTEVGRLTSDGALHLKECTTPTAIGSFGAIYTKADNHLYFQSGAGIEYDLGGA